jgi:hypothetical protein
MEKKTKNYVRDKQPKTLWNKIGPFVKLREYLASNITPDVYANERGLKTKIMEFFGQDVPKANVDDFSQNLWFKFLNQPNNLKEENGIVRIPDNIKSIISDRINGGWEKMAKKYGKELDSLDNKIIDGKVAGKDVSDLEELRDITSRKLGMVEEGMDLLKKARTGEHQVFNEYNFIPDAYGDLNDLSGLSSFTMYRDDRGRMVVKDKYDFYRNDQPIKVGIVTKTLDAIGYPFEIRDYVEDKIPYEESDPNKILFRSIIDSKNDLDKRMEIRSKKQGGESSKPEIDWDLFKSKYENMKRVGKGKHRTMDVEGMNMIYDALYDKGFNQRQIEAVLGNIIEESGGNPYAVSDYGGFKGLFQESDKRYPPKEFEKDKERFKSDKRGYINYMIDRFYDHVQDAGMYSIKDTKYDKAIHAVNEFMSEDPDTDYSYPLVYAFEAPSDKEGTYKNRKSVSNLISQSYVTDNVNNPDDADKKNNSIINAILDIKNDLELQDPISTTRGEAFKEARKRGLKEFTWNGKRYNTNIKKEGGAVDEENGSKYRYIASKDNTSVGSSGINENANYGTIPVDGVDINEIVAGGIPVVGDIMDVKDAYDSFIDRDALGMVMAAMGLIPFVGGISKKAMRAKRTTKKLSQRDKELLGSLPEYAKPASPIGEAWENHKKRLFSGAYERLTGERLRMKNGEPDPDMLDTNIYDWDDPKVFRDAKYFLGDEYSDDEIREIIDEISGYGVLNGNIIRSKNVDEFIDLFLEGNPNISNKDVENFIKSHEVEHKIHYPDSDADKSGFDLNKIGDDEVKDYFKEDHFTEMAARGTQIKNYFGLTDDAQEVTPEMLEYAARNYLKDYGNDNEMKEYFESISDYKKAAKWITDHASVGLGAYYVGNKIADPKKEKKRNGGKLTSYKAGFRFIDHKKEYGDPKDASHRFPGRKFMYFYENDKPSKSIVFAEEGGVIGKQREAYDYFTNKRGMSKIQALAIIGNLMAESGLKDDIYGDNRTSYGIQQWHNERMDKLFKHAKKKGHSTPTFKDQLEFLADEYEGKTGYSNFLYTRKGKEGPGYYNYSRQDFMNADNLKDAVVAWNQGAGRPHKSVIRNDDRYNYAMEVAKNLGLDIEENSVSSYGQMGFGDDGEIAASVTLPEVEVAAALPNPEAPSQERQSEEERFRTWTETYGKDIINHLLTLDGKKDGDDSDYSMMYRQHEKESEEDKKMALINAVLPNIQLRIKGVTDN